MRTGIANLPLHGGRAPAWLFKRMKVLAEKILELIALEFGPEEIVRRLSDPFWFQSLGNVLGFDWHSSGLTTTTTGAIKEALKNIGPEIGVFMAGGKGKTSLRTPDELLAIGERTGLDVRSLIYASRMTAKVDSTAIQDGYQIYHHTIIFTRSGLWAVVQQGMNEKTRYARRYHWIKTENFVDSPHTGIVTQRKSKLVLDTVAGKARSARQIITEIAKEHPEKNLKELKKLKELNLPRRHALLVQDINPDRIKKILITTYERQPRNFEELLGIRGLGPKSLRALALISDIIYGAPPSYSDPAIYSYAHGGKDGIPYPVDRSVYDRSIEILERAIKESSLGRKEKLEALRRLSKFIS